MRARNEREDSLTPRHANALLTPPRAGFFAFMARDIISDRIPEWRLQAEAVAGLESYLAEHPGAFAYAAGLEGMRLRPSVRDQARSTGMQAGEPDLRFYLPGGRLFLVEVKTGKGSLSAVQKERHDLLRALGFKVLTIRLEGLEHAREAVLEAVLREIAGNGANA